MRILDALTSEPGACNLLDRGYLNSARSPSFHDTGSFFPIRAKRDLCVKRRYSQPVDRRNAAVLCDPIGMLELFYATQDFPTLLRRSVVRDESGQRITLLTNNTRLAPTTLAELYRCRWQVELFFNRIKQYLRVKAFFGANANAVKTRLWIAVATCVMIAIIRKLAELPQSLYQILQIPSMIMFETPPSPRDTNQIRCHFNRFSSENVWTLLMS